MAGHHQPRWLASVLAAAGATAATGLLLLCVSHSRPSGAAAAAAAAEREEEAGTGGAGAEQQRPLKVVIAGGGIGGLSCALKLHQAGFDVTVYEMYKEIRSDLGLGINLLPHCTAVLHGLGLAPMLQATAIQTHKLVLGTNRGMTVWSEPRGLAAGVPTPQYSIHRGQLAKLLEAAVLRELGPQKLKLGHKLVSTRQLSSLQRGADASDSGGGGGVEVVFEKRRNGDEGERVVVEADVLIGCDGVNSAVRKQVGYTEKPKFTGWIAYRGAVEVPHSFTADGDGKTMVILGRVQDAEGRVVTGKNDADLVCYPISNELHASGRSLLNWVCEYKVPVDQHPGEESWTRFGDKAELLANVSDFGSWRYQNIVASEMIERTEQVYKFCVYDRDPVPRWSFDCTTLLGDAAHPMLPFGSNGAGQAILDVESIGECLKRHCSGGRRRAGDVVAALREYEAERLEKANAVVLATRKGGDHMPFGLVSRRFGGEELTEAGLSQVRDEIVQLREGYIKTAGYTAEQLAKGKK